MARNTTEPVVAAAVACPLEARAWLAGSPHARYALTTTGDTGLIVDLIAIEYDHMAAVKRARANDRPEWAHGLERGFMPRR